MQVTPGAPVDGNQSCIVSVRDTVTGREVSEEYISLKEKLPRAADYPLTKMPESCLDEEGRFCLRLPDGSFLKAAQETTLLYRAATDNDRDPAMRNVMLPYYAQEEEILAQGRTAHGFKVLTRLTNKKGRYAVTDLYRQTEAGILVTSRLRRVSGKGPIPRFGKCFRLDESFEEVRYHGRAGESYADMKEQFPVRTVTCAVEDMTEPNIKPQESGNRCDCTFASISNGKVRVTFTALRHPFELGIKPYSDRELTGMKHREDEKRTGTYVTIQDFQQGIGTGSCGPSVMPEYQYDGKGEYVLRFLISVDTIEADSIDSEKEGE